MKSKGQIAYETYTGFIRRSTRSVEVMPHPFKVWDDLPQMEKNAWQSASDAVENVVTLAATGRKP